MPENQQMYVVNSYSRPELGPLFVLASSEEVAHSLAEAEGLGSFVIEDVSPVGGELLYAPAA